MQRSPLNLVPAAAYALGASLLLGGCDWNRFIRGGSKEAPGTSTASRHAPAGSFSNADRDGLFERESQLLSDRIVLLGTPLSDDVATDVISKLLYLESQDRAAPILLYINSPGGIATAGLAIIDTMAKLEPAVSTVVMKQASGIAVNIAAAGERGHRKALAGAFCELTPLRGGADALGAAERERLTHVCVTQLCSATGRTEDEVHTAMEEARAFSGADAVAWGLLDVLLHQTDA
ncbi:MAG: ATP-dependent Clp protease proteolytic subunit [Myxococcota bacterium]